MKKDTISLWCLSTLIILILLLMKWTKYYCWCSVILLSKKEPEISNPFNKPKCMWNSLVSFARTRLPIKHTTNSITITNTNIIIISTISHLPPVLLYKKGGWNWKNSKDVIYTLEYHCPFWYYVPFFVGFVPKALPHGIFTKHLPWQRIAMWSYKSQFAWYDYTIFCKITVVGTSIRFSLYIMNFMMKIHLDTTK